MTETKFISFRLGRRQSMVIAILLIAFVLAFVMRSLPLQYGFYLHDGDPFFNARATHFLLENGLEQYFAWHDYKSWYPEGRPIAHTSQTGLHLSAAFLYLAFGGNASLNEFTIWFPVVFSSLTVVVIFLLVRVISGTTAGLFASLLFAVSIPIILRGNLGWFKSEPLGLFLGLLATYLLLSALKDNERSFAIAKAVGGGLILGFGITAWGGVQYFTILLGLFFMALPFVTREPRSSIYIVPIFTALTILSASYSPRTGLMFFMSLGGLSLIAPTIFLVVAHFVRLFNVERRLRNTLACLGAFVTISVFAATRFEPPTDPRYLMVINPFNKSQDLLNQAVGEHFTPDMVHFILAFSVLIPLAGYGVMLSFRKRSDMMMAFVLVLGISGVYVGAAMGRLLVYSSIAIIVLASIALFVITRSMFARQEEDDVAASNDKLKVQHSGKGSRIAYTAMIIIMLLVPMFHPPGVAWLDRANIPPDIVNGATVFKISTTDWTETMHWISNSTEPDAVIASWPDHGYWITSLGNRTSLADNSNLNVPRIQLISKAFTSDERTALNILKDLKADYVLVFVVGQRIKLQDGSTLVIPGVGGDESKIHWFMRFADIDQHRYLEEDSAIPKPLFWNYTLMGKMWPLKTVTYALWDDGRIVDIKDEYQKGYVPLYKEQVKYPEDSTSILRLVHASPSFLNKETRVMLAVLVYEVLKEGT